MFRSAVDVIIPVPKSATPQQGSAGFTMASPLPLQYPSLDLYYALSPLQWGGFRASDAYVHEPTQFPFLTTDQIESVMKGAYKFPSSAH